MSLAYPSQRNALRAAVSGIVFFPALASAATYLPEWDGSQALPASRILERAIPAKLPIVEADFIFLSAPVPQTPYARTDVLQTPLTDISVQQPNFLDFKITRDTELELHSAEPPISLTHEGSPKQFLPTTPCPIPGMISLQTLDDIENRIFRRIISGGSDSVATLTPMYARSNVPETDNASSRTSSVAEATVLGSAVWLSQFCGEIPPIAQGIALSPFEHLAETTDPSLTQVSLAQTDANLAPNDTSDAVNSPVFYQSGSAGGSASSANLAPITATLAQATLTSAALPNHPSIAWLPAARSASTYPSQSTAPIASRFTSVAAPLFNSPPMAAQLPAGLTGFQISDLNPVGSAWTYSQAARISGTKLGGFVSNISGTLTHAALWNGATKGLSDLHPTSGMYVSSRINDLAGTEAVGTGDTGRSNHALLWINANPDSAVDLNPVGFNSSYALATTGTQQFGYGYPTATPEVTHALLWNDSAASFVDLNPTGFILSAAYAGDARHQAGYGQNKQNELHALAWSGRADTAIDIHPTSGAFMDSRAVTLLGTEVAGFGTVQNGYQHAILWTSLSGDSAIDINPTGFLSSEVLGLSALGEVGSGRLANDYSGHMHALLWTPDGLGYVDLSTYLPSRYISSEATGIDAAGNIVGFATDSVTGGVHAVEWVSSVPEPASLAAIGLIAITLYRPKKRRSTYRDSD
jgi:hypothetical protein